MSATTDVPQSRRLHPRPSQFLRSLGDDRRRADPCTIVIFGAHGDLTKRKLLPAIYQLAKDKLLPDGCDILGTAREPMDDDDFRALMDGAGAFVYAGWCGNPECEAQIKEETKATIRVLPDEEFRSADPPRHCLKCGRDATAEALWAKAY